MNSHKWDGGGSITVEDRFGDPVQLTTFRCHKCESVVTIRGNRLDFSEPTEWEIEANGVNEDCDLENVSSIMMS